MRQLSNYPTGEKERDMSKRSGQAKSILDRSFRYTPSNETDLRKTFARIRREQRMQERARAQSEPKRITLLLTYQPAGGAMAA